MWFRDVEDASNMNKSARATRISHKCSSALARWSRRDQHQLKTTTSTLTRRLSSPITHERGVTLSSYPAIPLASGKFDTADRVFHSVAEAWQSAALSGSGDVKVGGRMPRACRRVLFVLTGRSECLRHMQRPSVRFVRTSHPLISLLPARRSSSPSSSTCRTSCATTPTSISAGARALLPTRSARSALPPPLKSRRTRVNAHFFRV